MMKKFTQKKILYYLIKGTLVTVPVAGAIFLIVWVFASLDNALNLTTHFLEDEQGHPLYIPGIGILTVLIILILVGVVFTTFVTEPIRARAKGTIDKIPLFNTLYCSIKDFTEAFVGDAKKCNEEVLVLAKETGEKIIGFITQRERQKIALPDEAVVYFPCSYSLAGELAGMKASIVRRLDMTETDATKLVVSGGVGGIE